MQTGYQFLAVKIVTVLAIFHGKNETLALAVEVNRTKHFGGCLC